MIIEFVIGGVIAGLFTLLAWSLSKVYSNVHEKISLNKDISGIRLDSIDMKKSLEHNNITLNRLDRQFNALKESNLRLAKNTKDALELVVKHDRVLKENKKTLDRHGQVIQIIEDAKKKNR